MKELSTKDMTAYLKMAMELEASVYSQREAIDSGKYELRHTEPKLRNIKEPRRKNVGSKPEYIPPKLSKESFILAFFVYYGYFNLTIGLFIMLILSETAFGNHPIFLELVISIIPVAYITKVICEKKYADQENKKKEYDSQYYAQVAEYEKNKQEADQRYNDELLEYQKEVELAEQEYSDQKMRHEIAERDILALNEPLEQTCEILEKLYSLDIIFPKYRELVAISTIYEYFVTGRCTKLTGTDGAYNLYESELRQNIIIGQLDDIIDELEAIRQNQYTLYSELKKIESALDDIVEGVNNIMESVERIENNINESSYIISYCAQVTAKNTEALKYIALINCHPAN